MTTQAQDYFDGEHYVGTAAENYERGAPKEARAAFERDVVARWQEFATHDGLRLTVTMTTVTARR